jgi:hypothetical protein
VTDPEHITLVHGNARVADCFAKRFAYNLGWNVIDCDPDWKPLGRKTGLVRNATMVTDHRPHFVLAFLMRRGSEKLSRGTEHCIGCVKRYRSSGRLVDLRVFYTDIE